MKVEKDYADMLKSFNKNRVRYLIVGAFAVGFYARPRYTKDILVVPTEENARRILAAVAEFGFRSLGLVQEDFCREGMIIQLGYEPVRIDLLTSLEGIKFAEAWKNRKRGTYGDRKVTFIGLSDLIAAKKRSKRLQDQADLQLLLAALRPRHGKTSRRPSRH